MAKKDVPGLARSNGRAMPKQMHLALDVSWTQVETAWRLPGSWVGRHYPDVGLFEDIARIDGGPSVMQTEALDGLKRKVGLAAAA